MLLTTHYIEEAEALCERVAFIRKGRIAAEGAVSELVSSFGGGWLKEAYLGGDALMNLADLGVVQRRGLVALALREARRVLSRWTQTILPPVVTALLFLVVFGAALGPRIGDIEGLDYVAFVLPGLLVMTTVGPAIANASTSLYQAKSEGYIEDVLMSPLRAWQIVAGYAAGSATRAWAAALSVALAAAPFTGGATHPLAAVAALALAVSSLPRSVSSSGSRLRPLISTPLSQTWWCRRSRSSRGSSALRARSRSRGRH